MSAQPWQPLNPALIHEARRPSRFEAQAEAVSRIFFLKTQDNPESKVGLMSMGGKGPEVLVTLTSDFGKILEGVHRTKIEGSTHFATSIQIAGVSTSLARTCLGPSWLADGHWR